MTDFKELREALDVVEASPEFVKGQWAIEPEMFEPDCLCDEDIAYIAAANPATIRALLAELDAARKDAERYRWLRDDLDSDWAICEWSHDDSDGIGYYRDARPDNVVDAAIDAAMKEQQP